MSEQKATAAEQTDAKHASPQPQGGSGAPVTLSNVHTLSTYELRQELVRRNELHLKEGDPVNYRILLQMLVEVLTREEQQRQLEHMKNVEQAQAEERERYGFVCGCLMSCRNHVIILRLSPLRLKALREERKREAMERSRLRQADPSYFAARAPPPPQLDVKEQQEKAEEGEMHEEEQTEQTNQPDDDDPFRSTTSKFKVFVR